MTTRRSTIAAGAAVLAVTSGVLVGAGAPAHAQPGECGNSDVRASYQARGAGAGHRYGVVRLTNVTGTTCFVRGWGGLSYVGHGDGTQVGASAERDAGRLRTVVLDPGESVVSRVDETAAGNYPRARCHPTPVDGFRVYVPDAHLSQYVPHRTTGCADAGVHLLGHQPYRAARDSAG